MPLFRFHRGGLDESMATVKEVSSLDDVKKLAKFPWKSKGKLTCKWYAYDDRIKWDTWIICDELGVYGFSNAELK